MNSNHTLTAPVDIRRWLTDASYNEELHRQSIEAARKLGEKRAIEANKRFWDAIQGKWPSPDSFTL